MRKTRSFSVGAENYEMVYGSADGTGATLQEIFIGQRLGSGGRLAKKVEILSVKKGSAIKSLDYRAMELLKKDAYAPSGIAAKLYSVMDGSKTKLMNSKLRNWKGLGLTIDSDSGNAYILSESGKVLLENMDEEYKKVSESLKLSLNPYKT